MNKKFLAFGVIGILALVVVSAAVVSYLSNTSEVDVSINKPLVMTGDLEKVIDAHAGETFSYSLTTENQANIEVWSFPVTEVTAPEGTYFDGTEFTEIILKDNNYPAGISIKSLMKYADSDGVLHPFSEIAGKNMNTAKIVFDNGVTFNPSKGYVRPVGFYEFNDISITTNVALASGTYVIKSCQLYDLKGSCN